jgi:hypothetical protein
MPAGPRQTAWALVALLLLAAHVLLLREGLTRAAPWLGGLGVVAVVSLLHFAGLRRWVATARGRRSGR